jgi:hypothetical protein
MYSIYKVEDYKEVFIKKFDCEERALKWATKLSRQNPSEKLVIKKDPTDKIWNNMMRARLKWLRELKAPIAIIIQEEENLSMGRAKYIEKYNKEHKEFLKNNPINETIVNRIYEIAEGEHRIESDLEFIDTVFKSVGIFELVDMLEIYAQIIKHAYVLHCKKHNIEYET